MKEREREETMRVNGRDRCSCFKLSFTRTFRRDQFQQYQLYYVPFEPSMNPFYGIITVSNFVNLCL